MCKKEKTQRRRALPANLALVSSIRKQRVQNWKSTRNFPSLKETSTKGDKYYVHVGKIARAQSLDADLVLPFGLSQQHFRDTSITFECILLRVATYNWVIFNGLRPTEETRIHQKGSEGSE
jgi:hypothetical protein